MELGDGEGFAVSLSRVVHDARPARPATSLHHLPGRGASEEEIIIYG